MAPPKIIRLLKKDLLQMYLCQLQYVWHLGAEFKLDQLYEDTLWKAAGSQRGQ